MNIKFTNKPTYAEEGQPNPIRWCILSGTPETGFINETSWLRCKDFFNDYVVAYNGGKRFQIYGFSTEKMNIPAKGQPVYIAVDALTKSFYNNLGCLNAWLKENNTPVIKSIEGMSHYILEFDSFYFNNTYNISLISLIIRLLNVEEKFEDFGDVLTYKAFATKDQQKWDKAVEAGRFFNIPEQLNKYIWYCGAECNSEKPPADYSLPSVCHNNGMLSWTTYMKGMT